MAKVTGLGGIFYKVADPAKTQAWYKEMLGIGGDWGANFRWSDETGEDPLSLLELVQGKHRLYGALGRALHDQPAASTISTRCWPGSRQKGSR